MYFFTPFSPFPSTKLKRKILRMPAFTQTKENFTSYFLSFTQSTFYGPYGMTIQYTLRCPNTPRYEMSDLSYCQNKHIIPQPPDPIALAVLTSALHLIPRLFPEMRLDPRKQGRGRGWSSNLPTAEGTKVIGAGLYLELCSQELLWPQQKPLLLAFLFLCPAQPGQPQTQLYLQHPLPVKKTMFLLLN